MGPNFGPQNSRKKTLNFMPKNSGPLNWEGVDSASDKILFYEPKMKIFYRSLQNMFLLTIKNKNSNLHINMCSRCNNRDEKVQD